MSGVKRQKSLQSFFSKKLKVDCANVNDETGGNVSHAETSSSSNETNEKEANFSLFETTDRLSEVAVSDSNLSVSPHESSTTTTGSNLSVSPHESTTTTTGSNLSVSPYENPAQPVLLNFPSENGRKFSKVYYSSYCWVEYCIKDNAVFCFCCRHFANNSIRPGENLGKRAFIDHGFKKYRDAKQLLAQHDQSERHKNAMEAWISFKKINAKESNSIAESVIKFSKQEVLENRHHVKALFEITSLLGRQGLAFRGHEESQSSDNHGNFKEVSYLLAKHDPILKKNFGRKYGNYCSPEYQNDCIEVYRNYIKKKIVEEVKKAGYFSVTADETKDVSKKEQLAVLIRYVDSETLQIKERAIGVHHVKDLSAQSLSSEILNDLKSLNIDPGLCVGQCYDGARVMSGHVSGVQTRFRLEAPCAIYVHCNSHCLNLVLVHTLTKIKEAEEFFSTVKSLYNFITNSNTRNQLFIKAQQELSQTVIVLERTAETRWFYWVKAVEKIKRRLEAIIITLKAAKKIDQDAEAVGLLNQVKKQSFIFQLVMFDHLLGITSLLSDQLQAQELDFSRVNILIESTAEQLVESRTDDVFSKLETEASKLALNLGINIEKTIKSSTRIKRISSRLANSVVDSTLGQRHCENLKILYYEIIDRMLEEFNQRFTGNKELISSLQSFDINSAMFLDVTSLEPFLATYAPLLEKETLATQLEIAKKSLLKIHQANNEKEKFKAPISRMSVGNMLKELNHFPVAFSEVVKVLKIHQTLAVTTVENERLFSVLKRVKNHLRNSMGDERLEGLMLMAAEKEEVKNADLEHLVDEFDGLKERRFPLK